jgi:hypothetical protein
MCHIVTHHRLHRQGMPHRSRRILSGHRGWTRSSFPATADPAKSPRRERHRCRRRSEVPGFSVALAAHVPAHRERADRVPAVLRWTLRLMDFQPRNAGPKVGALVGTLRPIPMCACWAHVVVHWWQ